MCVVRYVCWSAQGGLQTHLTIEPQKRFCTRPLCSFFPPGNRILMERNSELQKVLKSPGDLPAALLEEASKAVEKARS